MVKIYVRKFPSKNTTRDKGFNGKQIIEKYEIQIQIFTTPEFNYSS